MMDIKLARIYNGDLAIGKFTDVIEDYFRMNIDEDSVIVINTKLINNCLRIMNKSVAIGHIQLTDKGTLNNIILNYDNVEELRKDLLNKFKGAFVFISDKEKFFEIWREGNENFEGYDSGAVRLGCICATTFEEACRLYFTCSIEYNLDLFNADELTYMNCKLFDNEIDARQRTW